MAADFGEKRERERGGESILSRVLLLCAIFRTRLGGTLRAVDFLINESVKFWDLK